MGLTDPAVVALEALEKAHEAAQEAERFYGRATDEGDRAAMVNVGLAQAWSFVSLAASNLIVDEGEAQPIDVVTADVIGRLHDAEEILSSAARTGRRHPAIHAALDIIRRSDP